MSKPTLLLLMIIGCPALILAQSSSSTETPKVEYFVGYSASGSLGEGEPLVINNQNVSSFFNDHAGGSTGFEPSVIGTLNPCEAPRVIVKERRDVLVVDDK